MKLIRGNPSILASVLHGAADADEVFKRLQAVCMERPVVNMTEVRDGITTYWAEPTCVAKPVFNVNHAPHLATYLRNHSEEVLAAFHKRTDCGIQVLAGSRWQIVVRVLMDIRNAITTQKRPDPFEGLPMVTSIPDGLRAPKTQRNAAEAFGEVIVTKPGNLQSLPEVKQWPGVTSGTNLHHAAAAVCQVHDLVPASDMAAFASAFQGLPLELTLNDVDAQDLFDVLLWLVERHPAPEPASAADTIEALKDFVIGERETVTASQCAAVNGWMRELPPGNYKACRFCGFPVFDKDRATTDTGWQAGSILGGGWQIGTSTSETVDVPICLCCKAEKIVAEGGIRKFGRHPIHVHNIGFEVIPASAIDMAFGMTWCLTDDFDFSESTRKDLTPGTSDVFGDMADGQDGVIAEVPSIPHIRARLTYAYFSLWSQGYKVAFDVPHTKFPRGIFGFVPPEATTLHPDEAGVLARRELFRRRVAGLAAVGLVPSSENKKPNPKSVRSLERGILTAPHAHVLTHFYDAISLAEKAYKPHSEVQPAIFSHVADLLSTTPNGECPMTSSTINLREEAIAWAEATYPYLLSRKDFGSKGGDTKAFREVIDNILAAGTVEERIGAGVSGLMRSIKNTVMSGDKCRLKAEDRDRLQSVTDDLTARIARYAEMPPHELARAVNHIAPMISMAVRFGLRLSPDLPQNNYVIRLGRRLNDPADAA